MKQTAVKCLYSGLFTSEITTSIHLICSTRGRAIYQAADPSPIYKPAVSPTPRPHWVAFVTHIDFPPNDTFIINYPRSHGTTGKIYFHDVCLVKLFAVGGGQKNLIQNRTFICYLVSPGPQINNFPLRLIQNYINCF